MKIETEGRTGVWVTGPSRSGTSMVAGLFAAHGVFFGESISPNPYNPKGFFENVWLKSYFSGKLSGPVDWPDDFFEALAEQGWCGCGPWGVKAGPTRSVRLLGLGPSLIVVCRRPIEEIVASRAKVHWARGNAKNVAERAYQQIEDVVSVAGVPAVEVRTDELVHGATTEIRSAFEALGRPFSPAVARDWIDPSLWNRP